MRMLEVGWREIDQRGNLEGDVAPKRLRTTDLEILFVHLPLLFSFPKYTIFKQLLCGTK